MSEAVKALLNMMQKELEKMDQKDQDEFYDVLANLIFTSFSSPFQMSSGNQQPREKHGC